MATTMFSDREATEVYRCWLELVDPIVGKPTYAWVAWKLLTNQLGHPSKLYMACQLPAIYFYIQPVEISGNNIQGNFGYCTCTQTEAMLVDVEPKKTNI